MATQPLIEFSKNPDALITVKTAAALAARGVSTLYLLARTDPTFPRLIKRGARCTRIKASDMQAWLQQQAEVSCSTN